jgi:2-polyprenyl-3-methyl-5-hydroxy-6-metoxy-1,4-benzoquinol methylase
MTNLISPEYKELIKRMHKIHTWGADGHKHCAAVNEIVAANNITTVLDYGCGRGTLKKELLKNKKIKTVFEYDPAIKGKDASPGEADLVVCTDVLEHIEADKIDDVLDHIDFLSIKAAYLIISCRYANAVLPNGKNAHLIVKPPQWWKEKISNVFSGKIEFSGNEKELRVVIIK